MNLPVWLYWEGERPEWISWCEQTVFAHAADVRPLNAADFDALRTDDRDIDLAPLTCVQRADFARAYLLHRYGGMWIDSDCLVMRDLQRWLDWLEHYEFAGYKNRQNHVANAFMAARPGSRIAAEFYRRICARLRSQETLWWDSLGSITLGATVQDLNLPWLEIDCELIEPVCWSVPEAFFATRTDRGHRAVYNERSFCYMLSKTNVDRFLGQWPKRSLLEPMSFFRYLHKRALETAAPPHPAAPAPAWDLVPFCAEAIRDIAPRRVLDAGMGFGSWGMIVRDAGDAAAGRSRREDWQICLEGIAPVGAVLEEYQRQLYNWIHVGDTGEVLNGMDRTWDLILLHDCAAALPRALELSAYVLVMLSGEGRAPGFESGMEPVRRIAFSGQRGSETTALLLSRSNPRNLGRKTVSQGSARCQTLPQDQGASRDYPASFQPGVATSVEGPR